MLHFLTTENPKYHGPARSHLTLYIEANGGRLRLGATDMQNANARHGLTQGPLRGGYNGKLYDSKDALLADADWHCVEAMFKLNSLDVASDEWNADGELRGWFDGKLVIERTDVILRTTDFPRMKLNQFLLAPAGQKTIRYKDRSGASRVVAGQQVQTPQGSTALIVELDAARLRAGQATLELAE